MKKLIILFLSIVLISCLNNSNKDRTTNSTNKVVSFNVTSKNSKLTSKSGKDVSLNEMRTINVTIGEKTLFKNFYFTLENKVEGGFNFFSKNGNLMCTAPAKLSIMSMPPNGQGLNTYKAGENFEINGMTLIKIDSINFVITDINLK